MTILQEIVTAITLCVVAESLWIRTAEAQPSDVYDGLLRTVRNTNEGGGTASTRITAATRDILKRTIEAAGRRLKRQDCTAFFGSESIERLMSAEYKLLSLGAPRFQGNEPVVTAARTIRDLNMIVINLDGPFLNPRLPLAGRYHYFNAIASRSNGPIILSDDEFRVLILLHELGHLIGKFGPDRRDTQKAEIANTAVLRHCFQSG